MSTTEGGGKSGYTSRSPEPTQDESKQSHCLDGLPEEDLDEQILCSVTPVGLEGDDIDSVKMFILKGENHTMGNLLRDQILKYPLVNFCGYSIPHPSEEVLHLRIQTVPGSGVSATAMLKKGLEDVLSMCDHVEDLFNEQLKNAGFQRPADIEPQATKK